MNGTIPILNQLHDLKDGEETIIFVHGQPFIISRATDDDIERIGKGYFCLD